MGESRPVVLVVDDDPDALAVLARTVLAATGAVVVRAATVGEACRLLRSAHPSLVVCDVVMPGGGGRAVEAEAAHVGVPCQLVSSAPPCSAAMACRVADTLDVARLAGGWLARATTDATQPPPGAPPGRRAAAYVASVVAGLVAAVL